MADFGSQSIDNNSVSLINQRLEGNYHQSRCSNRHLKLVIGVFFVICVALASLLVLFITRQNDTEKEIRGAPKGPQMLTEQSEDRLSVLESLGLDFWLSGFSSTCPSGLCRNCTRAVFKDSKPYIKPRDDCHSSHTTRVKNASCLLCDGFPRGCLSFQDVLENPKACSFKVNDCELDKMANLNGYCNGGEPIHDDNDVLRCNCPHGKSGDHCEDDEETGQLLCHCYKRRFKLLEEKEGWEDCDNVYYGNNTHCLDSRQEENCICYNTEEPLSRTESCNSGRMKRQTNACLDFFQQAHNVETTSSQC